MSIPTDVLQALFGGWSQHDRFLWITTPLGANALVAESLHGWEALDHGGFRFQLTALAENPSLPLAQLIGAPILIEWQAAQGRDARRPFHGHVIAAELIGYNGGLARMRLVVEPWLALLRQRIDSYNYLNASVVEISEQVFRRYTRGAIAPAWRWALADATKYPKRSLTAQAGESDFALLERLWAEEGIFYWFEHEGDPRASSLGKHTLVLADSNQRFAPDEPEIVGFHQTSDDDPQGCIQHFMHARRWRIGSVARASWDHRSLSTRPTGARASGAVVPGEDRDVAGPYAFQTGAIGDRRAQQQLDAQRVAALQSEGRSTRRDLRPGLRFAIAHHPTLGASDALVCLRVEHSARANVDATVRSAIEQRLGTIPSMTGAAPAPHGAANALHAALGVDTHHGGQLTLDDAVYRNRFVALPVEQAYRPLAASGHGARAHPVAVMPGAQTTIVVGSGDPVHTDRDHRIRIQHHAQRGQQAASREDHPHAANAPADRSAGTWTRVLTPVGGDNWGGVSVPRIGQEVWTEWLEGQPDRPVAVAALYNGQGNADAQHNAQAGGPSGSTGNAAAWFAGNTHAAVLTGFKTQDMSMSQQGTGGYRQFMLDDTAGQSSARLYTTDRNSGLTLGHIKQTQDNQRQADRGYGAELATDAAGALRGGAGLLISTAPGVSQMDASAPSQVLAQHRQTLQSLAELAQKHGAEPGNGTAVQAPSAADTPPASTGNAGGAGNAGNAAGKSLPAVEGVERSREAIGVTREGSGGGDAAGGGSGSAIAWSKPHLVAHGEAGLVAMSAKSHVWVSGAETVLSAGQDVQLTAKGKTSVVANHGVSLYTQGAAGGGRPVAGQGIALHAATGSVSVQAQNAGKLSASAQKAVTVASAQGSASVQAQQRVLLTAAKAYLKMEGNDIVVGAPGRADFKAAAHQLTGPKSASAQNALGKGASKDCPQTMSDMVSSSAAFADL
ncbi:type IV secretion protein Rhs [Burkholderia sp. MSMB617WGS]|uniref:type VI secretion system Vgr family protein n=1 Tax=Burkholderia sp. MSMB617WGS TaxID=1637831 RepID=UPI00075FFACA|nr:type VI secretion system Vgr family protein [Burkholderia sp. MSMB617WGS]AOK47336.1 type IV secretion protein Rhs [Burkholderia sp. MSMB617WGS]